jgi:hypothetical protein
MTMERYEIERYEVLDIQIILLDIYFFYFHLFAASHLFQRGEFKWGLE